MATYTLTYSNSDDCIASVEFKTLTGAKRAAQRIGFLGGCPLMIADGQMKLYAETREGRTEFAS